MKLKRILSLLLCLALAAGLLLPAASAAEAPQPTAKAALLVDITYGEKVLFEQNVREKMYPAGLTSVMTALLVIEAADRGELSLDQPITVNSSVSQGLPWGVLNQEIRVGEVIPVGDLLRCALITGALDACNVLADAAAGSIEAFVQRMNERAAELGCEGTRFANPHGLHDDGHYTTAWDFYLICRKAMESEAFREIVGSKSYVVPATNLHAPRELHNTNSLVSNGWRLNYLYKYATGIRTGITDEAGQCLAASAFKDDRELICIVLGCQRAPNSAPGEGFVEFTEAKDLFEWGFNSFSYRSVATTTDLQGDVGVTLSKTQWVAAQPAGTISAILPNDVSNSELTYDVQWKSETVAAPVQKGQVLGTLTVSYGSETLGTVDLVAVAGVERSQLRFLLAQVAEFFSQLWVKILLISLALLVLILILWAVFFRKRRRAGYSSARSHPRPRSGYRGGQKRNLPKRR